MEISKKPLMDLIKRINNATDKLIAEGAAKNKEIEELKIQNNLLKENNIATLDQIREYIIEQIRTHYVDSNNNSK